MRLLKVLVAASAFALITSCGSSGNGSTSVIPPVSAASSYSNASVSGTYSILLPNPYGSMIGSFVADGNGNISSATLTQTVVAGSASSACSATFTGTYNIQTSASGSATIKIISTPATGKTSSDCSTPSGTYAFALQAGQQGESILFAESDGVNNDVFGTAVKQ